MSQGQQLYKQLLSVGFTAVFAPAVTLLILVGMRAVMGSLRVSDEDEFEGLDLAEHSETAYVFGATSGSPVSHGAAVAGGSVGVAQQATHEA